MAINPELITTIRVDQLPDETLSLTNLFPHTVGTDLKSATIQELVDLVATSIGVSGGVGYLAISVTDGQQLPDVPELPGFFLCGAGTYLNINGYPDVICTDELNAVMSLTDHWQLAVGIPIVAEVGVQSVTGSAVDNTDPLNPVINEIIFGVQNIIAGTNIDVDDTDPANPIISVIGGGGTQDLQQVTDEGNETTNDVIVKDSENKISLQPRGIQFQDIDQEGSTTLRFEDTDVADQEVFIRGKSGTMALTSDITTPTLSEVLTENNETDGNNIAISDGDAIILDNGANLKKGTTDAGLGGTKGIALRCAVDYELKWEAGRLYVMGGDGFTIREVSHNFTTTPTVTDDDTKGFVIDSRWILDNGHIYVCTDNTTGAAAWEFKGSGTTPSIQEVLTDGGDTAEDSAIYFTNTGNDFETSINQYGDSKIILKSVSNDIITDIDAGLIYLGNFGLTDYAIINKDGIIVDTISYPFPSGASSPLATLADIAGGGGGVTSVGLTMPSAFSVTNSPITSSGDIAVSGAGLVSQYVRGDGTLANFPNSTGGGSSVNYYLNGSVSQGTFGGDTYYEMSKTPILGAGTNFTRTNGQGNGYIASFITDAGDPSFLNIPGGNWNVEFYFQSSSTGGSPQFYAELYKVSATNVFTLVASGSANPEGITNGIIVDQYFTSIPVPQTSLLVTDRLAVRIYVITSGKTITLHTENGNLCELLTTFTTGLTALNGLTAQVQNLAVGTSGTDFAISSATDTHTFNLPTASATNRGALSSTDWSTFNGKQNPLSYTPYKNIQTSQTAHTGTTAETVLFTATIPAGAFNSTDIIKVLFGANKTTASGTYTLRLRVNTTNTITGAPTIAQYNGSAPAQANVVMRNYNLNGGNLYGVSFSTTAITDVFAGAGLSSTPLNPANQFFIFGTVLLANAGDSIIGNMFSIHN
jgi:hypothetical protein